MFTNILLMINTLGCEELESKAKAPQGLSRGQKLCSAVLESTLARRHLTPLSASEGCRRSKHINPGCNGSCVSC